MAQTYRWPIRTVAESGIQVVYSPPYERHPPGLNLHRGIGIKKKGLETWEDLYEVKLHALEWDYYGGTLSLPRMGMPPREPTEQMMQFVRHGEPFDSSGWFAYAAIFKASDVFPPNMVQFPQYPKQGYRKGDDVVITLPPACLGYHGSTMVDERGRQKPFEFRTALPANDSVGQYGDNNDFNRLFFIQLLPNEWPSYHFWANDNDEPLAHPATDPRTNWLFAPGANLNSAGQHRTQTMRYDPPSKTGNLSPKSLAQRTIASPGNNVESNEVQMSTSPPSSPNRFTKRTRAVQTHSPKKLRSSAKLTGSSSGSSPDKSSSPGRKRKRDPSYTPEKGEGEEPQEVKLNKRPRKISESSKPYRP